MDQVLKKAIAKRDEAVREAARWENWIKTYAELADPLDIPMSGRAAPPIDPADDLDIPSAVRALAVPAEGGGGNGLLPRSGTAN
jgi:hypothetical protein